MDKLKKCPFCKGEAELVKDPLWNDWNGGHGYQGCYNFYVRCNNKNCTVKPKSVGFDTIYEKNEDLQKDKAIAAWNNRDQK